MDRRGEYRRPREVVLEMTLRRAGVVTSTALFWTACSFVAGTVLAVALCERNLRVTSGAED